jgi:hypothetical protein
LPDPRRAGRFSSPVFRPNIANFGQYSPFLDGVDAGEKADKD